MGELRAQAWKDIELEQGTLTVTRPKSGKREVLPLNQTARRLLTCYKDNITKNFGEEYSGNATQWPALTYGGSSLDYMPAGNLIAFRPHNAMKSGQGDLFWEHHLARYRELLNTLQRAQ